MSAKWVEAAEKYRRRNHAAEQKEARKYGRPEEPKPVSAFDQAVLDLKAFLQSPEGHEARVLLEESNEYVPLGEYEHSDSGWDADCGTFDHGTYTIGIRFDGTGLFRVGGEGLAWCGPASGHVSVKEAVASAVNFLRLKPEEILSHIRAELDRVAERAPKE